jgi:chloramphenicol O-acetyltransferase type A
MRIANRMVELRYRIRGAEVVEHEVVHPSFTVMTAQGLFNYCTTDFLDDFTSFLRNTRERTEQLKRETVLQTESDRDDLIYITCLPWVSFTSITHPIHMHPTDSIPRISWGKFFEDSGRMQLPFSVQAHHALVDGRHIGRFYEEMQDELNRIIV